MRASPPATLTSLPLATPFALVAGGLSEARFSPGFEGVGETPVGSIRVAIHV